MRILFAVDIHGNERSFYRIFEQAESLPVDAVVLGEIYFLHHVPWAVFVQINGASLTALSGHSAKPFGAQAGQGFLSCSATMTHRSAHTTC